jgi:hypothetical protein
VAPESAGEQLAVPDEDLGWIPSVPLELKLSTHVWQRRIAEPLLVSVFEMNDGITRDLLLLDSSGNEGVKLSLHGYCHGNVDNNVVLFSVGCPDMRINWSVFLSSTSYLLFRNEQSGEEATVYLGATKRFYLGNAAPFWRYHLINGQYQDLYGVFWRLLGAVLCIEYTAQNNLVDFDHLQAPQTEGDGPDPGAFGDGHANATQGNAVSPGGQQHAGTSRTGFGALNGAYGGMTDDAVLGEEPLDDTDGLLDWPLLICLIPDGLEELDEAQQIISTDLVLPNAPTAQALDQSMPGSDSCSEQQACSSSCESVDESQSIAILGQSVEGAQLGSIAVDSPSDGKTSPMSEVMPEQQADDFVLDSQTWELLDDTESDTSPLRHDSASELSGLIKGPDELFRLERDCARVKDVAAPTGTSPCTDSRRSSLLDGSALKLVDVIARGGFADVYVADLAIGGNIRVAAKRSAKKLGDGNEKALIEHEAAVLAAIPKHANGTSATRVRLLLCF